MGRALSADLRWRVVWGRDLLDLSIKTIARSLQINKRTVQRILRRFDATGAVRSFQGKPGGLEGEAGSKKMTYEQDMKLLELVTIMDDRSMLNEIALNFADATGTDVHISTICRAMRRLGFTRKKARRRTTHHASSGREPPRCPLPNFAPPVATQLHNLAIQCDELRACQFYNWIMTNCAAHQLLFIDETSKDHRALNRSYGYALRGMKPRSNLGNFSRGDRWSFLAAFDLHGFVDYYAISGTFKSDDFLDGAEVAILPHVTPWPGPRSVVVLDNASIHKRQEFVDAVKAKGATVVFLPPYCWFLNPIEEGFGHAKQWVQRNDVACRAMGKTILFFDAALKSITPAMARSCFHSCGYL